MTSIFDLKAVGFLFQEDNWYLVDAAQVDNKYYKGKSFIVHDCPNYTTELKKSIGYLYRRIPSWLKNPCPSCGEVAPEALRGLFYIHNFNTIDDMEEGFHN